MTDDNLLATLLSIASSARPTLSAECLFSQFPQNQLVEREFIDLQVRYVIDHGDPAMSKPYDFEYAPTDDQIVEVADRGDEPTEQEEPVNQKTGHHRDCICSLCIGI